MANEWKCARCSTTNPESAISCQMCGAIRGAVVPTPAAPPPPDMPATPPADAAMLPGGEPGPTGAQPGWIPAAETTGPPPAPAPLWRRLPWGFLVVGVFVLGGAVVGWINTAGRSESGEITKAGELSPSDLRVGDCFDLEEPTASEVEKTAAKPCTETHAYEVFFAGKMPDGDYPTEDAFQAFVEANCATAFASYVGQSYELSKLEVLWFFPSDDGWDDGDRSLQCSLYDPANSQLTSSLKGSGQ